MTRRFPPPPSTRTGYWSATALLSAGVASWPFAAVTGSSLVAGGVLLLMACTWCERRRALQLGQRLAEVEAARQIQSEQLDEARSRYQQLFHHAIDALFLVDPHNGALLAVNHQAEQMLGYSSAEISQLSFGSLFAGRHRRRFLQLVHKILKDGYGEETHLQLRRKDGSQFYGDIQARLGQLGKQQVVYGTLRDVTSNVHLATELRRHHQHLELLNETALLLAEGRNLSPILATILDQVVTSLDVAGGGIFLLRHGRSELELAFQRGIPAAVAAELGTLRPGTGLVGRVATSGRPQLSVDLRNDQRRICSGVLDDGWRTFLAVPLPADESCLGVLFVFARGTRVMNRNDLRLLQSIGRQVGPLVKKAELFDELQWQHRLNQASLRELERSRTALRANLRELEHHHRTLQGLEQMKSAFLALASHELRTPLTVIWSGAELLQTTAEQLDETGQCALDAILHGTRRLRDLVDDLLEAARLEANSIYLAYEDFDPRPLCEGLLADFQSICAQRQLTCYLGAFPVPLTLRGDAHHLRRALRRLLENAVKFTPAGGWIRLEAALRSAVEVDAMAARLRRFAPAFYTAPRAAGYLEIRVCDSGLGLAPGEDEQIFSRFYTGSDIASHSSSRERFGGKGVGLGLTLARGLVTAHDGMLWAESAGRDRGSDFCMLLPLPAAEARLGCG
jgi:PAS domain S-box-containing protein